MDSEQKLKIKKSKTKDIKNELQFILLKRLSDNFPATELRSKTSQQKAFSHNKYWISYIEDENQNLLGFMLWWDFNQIRFIEYLFVEKDCRHNGIGSELLKRFKAYSIYSYKSPLDFKTFNFFEFIIHQDEYQF